MQVHTFALGYTDLVHRFVTTIRAFTGRGSLSDALDGVSMQEVRYTFKIGTALATANLSSCVAVVVVNLKQAFAAVGHCILACDCDRMLTELADKVSQRTDKDKVALQVFVLGGV